MGVFKQNTHGRHDCARAMSSGGRGRHNIIAMQGVCRQQAYGCGGTVTYVCLANMFMTIMWSEHQMAKFQIQLNKYSSVIT
jgi:hypothetical protein